MGFDIGFQYLDQYFGSELGFIIGLNIGLNIAFNIGFNFWLNIVVVHYTGHGDFILWTGVYSGGLYYPVSTGIILVLCGGGLSTLVLCRVDVLLIVIIPNNYMGNHPSHDMRHNQWYQQSDIHHGFQKIVEHHVEPVRAGRGDPRPAHHPPHHGGQEDQ